MQGHAYLIVYSLHVNPALMLLTIPSIEIKHTCRYCSSLLLLFVGIKFDKVNRFDVNSAPKTFHIPLSVIILQFLQTSPVYATHLYHIPKFYPHHWMGKNCSYGLFVEAISAKYKQLSSTVRL